jgi:ferrous iron transport protein B
MSASITIALIGNPNSGKTTLFNDLTGSTQKVGNWAGVTVDRKTGHFSYLDNEIEVVDLPGTYSLTTVSEQSGIDERIACEYILGGEADVLLNIIDAANLERNLYLTLQIREMQVPCVVAVNMLDIAKRQNKQIDLQALEIQLGCPVIALGTKKKKASPALKDALLQQAHKKRAEPFQLPCPQTLAAAISELEEAIGTVPTGVLVENKRYWLATHLLEGDLFSQKLVQSHSADVLKLRDRLLVQIEQAEHEDADLLIADARYTAIRDMTAQAYVHTKSAGISMTEWLDNILINRWLGLPAFFLIMYIMFVLSVNVGGALITLFDEGSAAIFINGVDYLSHQWGLPDWLNTVLSQGLGSGFNTVASFIPQIGLLFLFLAFLEDSGYMARAAFVMDRFMQWVGLPGKSFVPLIIGFGCNVPSIMATRTLDTPRDRILTTLMAPFMSCGARLAIFAVFAAAFYGGKGAGIVFVLYLTGIVVAILTGLIFKKSILGGEAYPFVMELPVYHLPRIGNILRMTWQRLSHFVTKAGRIIIPICFLISVLSGFSMKEAGSDSDNQSVSIDDTYLAYAGKLLTPALRPMGIQDENWPAAVGLITGALAKEVVIGTLNGIYSNASLETLDYENYSFWGELQSAWNNTLEAVLDLFSLETLKNPIQASAADAEMEGTAMGRMVTLFGSSSAAFAYLLFVLLYVPCVATIAVIAREVGSKWAWLSVFWSTSMAYTLAVIYYQLANYSQHPTTSLQWVLGLLFYNLCLFLLLKQFRHQLAPIHQPDVVTATAGGKHQC